MDDATADRRIEIEYGITNEQFEANQRLFPLRLTPFEKFIVWDETKSHPMCSFIELHFDTLLDVDLLERSLTAAVHRNPMLACTIVDHDGDLHWLYDSDYRPRLQMEASEPPLVSGRPIPFDLRSECGGRYWYGEQGGKSRFLIQLHHACTDGVGLRRVLIDALTGYAKAKESTSTHDRDGRTEGESTEPRRAAKLEKINVELLKERFDFSKTYPDPPAKELTTWQRIRNAHYFHFQLPKSLIGSAASSAVDASTEEQDSTTATEPLRHAVIDRVVSERINEKARSQGIGVNDVALAVLFQTCAKWNERYGESNPKSRFRLLMPYDLRSRVDLRMPATNRLSFSFLGRTRAQCGDLDTLIRSVHEEVKAIKESRLQMDFLGALEAGSKHPGLFRWVLGKSHRMATAVLTYTGDVSRGMKRYFPEVENARAVGDARLKNILVAPPVRRNTNIALGICVNWGQIGISAAWNRDALTASECEEFLSMYREIWTDWTNR